jgi:hypothetical protein
VKDYAKMSTEDRNRIENQINASRQRVQEITEGTRPNRTRQSMTAKYINACKQVGVAPSLV